MQFLLMALNVEDTLEKMTYQTLFYYQEQLMNWKYPLLPLEEWLMPEA